MLMPGRGRLRHTAGTGPVRAAFSAL